MIEGEAMQTFLKDYKIPAVAKPYVLDVSQHKVMGLKDWIGAQKQFKGARDEWTKRFK